MKTSEFIELLKAHTGKALVFSYAPGQFVGANYHITEVKNTHIESVDCGAGTDAWNETIIQLWESPKELGKRDYLSVYKALSILNKVNKIKPMDHDAEVKFEYGNSIFHTAQLFVNGYQISEGRLLINLTAVKTDCKAKETCGVPVEAEAAACCEGSGCC